jgi:hypothetical protein
MPNFDGKGPEGKGPTGRRRGACSKEELKKINQDLDDKEEKIFKNRRFGFFRGRGRGIRTGIGRNRRSED